MTIPLEKGVTNLFDYDAIKAAHRTASLITSPTGKPTNINLDTFVFTRGLAPVQRAREILGAINRGWIPGSADRDSAGVPSYKIIELPWITTNTSYWWAFDSSLKNDVYGLQYKESEPISLEGPNVVLTEVKHLLREIVVEKFCKFRETLIPIFSMA